MKISNKLMSAALAIVILITPSVALACGRAFESYKDDCRGKFKKHCVEQVIDNEIEPTPTPVVTPSPEVIPTIVPSVTPTPVEEVELVDETVSPAVQEQEVEPVVYQKTVVTDTPEYQTFEGK